VAGNATELHAVGGKPGQAALQKMIIALFCGHSDDTRGESCRFQGASFWNLVR
jgi:hypothetical protein